MDPTRLAQETQARKGTTSVTIAAGKKTELIPDSIFFSSRSLIQTAPAVRAAVITRETTRVTQAGSYVECKAIPDRKVTVKPTGAKYLPVTKKKARLIPVEKNQGRR